MADDSSQTKTEKATPRKLERSREKGQVAYSADLTGGLVLLFASILLVVTASQLWNTLKQETANCLVIMGHVDEYETDGKNQLAQSAWRFAVSCFPLTGLTFATTLLLGALVTGFRISPQSLEADFAKLNPVSGFGRIFSSRSFFRGGVAIVKLTIISLILYAIMRMQSDRIAWSVITPLDQTVNLTIRIVMGMLLGVSGGLTMIGVVDFGFQKWKHLEDMKMSRQEVKDEHKQDDGDPLVRARIKRLQREMGKRSMLKDVASATVVITNPTHYAIALKYVGGEMNAPVVVAKGKDFLAKKIIRIAIAHGVPQVERKPLARALYSSVSVGSEIPLELYQTVAEVLSYVHSIESIAGRRSMA